MPPHFDILHAPLSLLCYVLWSLCGAWGVQARGFRSPAPSLTVDIAFVSYSTVVGLCTSCLFLGGELQRRCADPFKRSASPPLC
jgi:hypothetical protein